MNKVQFYKDLADEWRWRVTSKNGNIIADSGEGYKNKGDAESGFALLFTEDVQEDESD